MSERGGTTRSRRRRRFVVLPLALMVAGTLAVAGCGSGSGSDDSGSSSETGVQAKPGAGAVGDVPGQPAQDPKAPADLRVNQRSIVYTGSITVRVDDVDAAAAEAVGIATGAGGFLGGDTRSSDRSGAEATLQLRVPADRFSGVVDSLSELGRQQRRDITTEDVTEESLDLDARITTQRARVDSGRRLLARASSLTDLVMLEGELAKREADLASLEAKKRRLADLAALSTITAVLLGPNAREDDDEPQGGFVAGLKGGWSAFVASLRVLLTVLGALLPWLLALGLPLAGVLWLLRRRRRNTRTATPAPALAPAAPSQRNA